MGLAVIQYVSQVQVPLCERVCCHTVNMCNTCFLMNFYFHNNYLRVNVSENPSLTAYPS